MDTTFKFNDRWESQAEHFDDYDDNRRYSIVTALPKGFDVWHEPSEVRATHCNQGFRWDSTTSIRPLFEDLEISQFGTFVRISDQWMFCSYSEDGHPYTPEAFCRHFEVADTRLAKNAVYRMNDYTENEKLSQSTLFFYIIGCLPNGDFVHGAAELTKLAELDTHTGP